MSCGSLQLICRVHLLTGPGTASLCIRNRSDGPEVKVGPTSEMLKTQNILVAWSKYLQMMMIIVIIIVIKCAPFTFLCYFIYIWSPEVCFVVNDKHLS